MAKAKKLPSGNARVLKYVGKDITKSGYKSFTAPTKAEAEFMAAQFVHEHKMRNERMKLDSANMTLRQAIDRFIKARDAILSPTTIEGYEKIKRNHFQGLMDIPIQKISEDIMQRAVNDECKKVSAATKKPLSPKTINNAYSFIVTVIKSQNRYIDFPGVATPRPVKIKYATPDPDGISAILKAAYGTKIELPVLLAVWLSMSMEEIRGLKWDDIKDDHILIHEAIVTVNGEHIKKGTKVEERTRKIILPNYIKHRIGEIEKEGEYVTTLTGQAIYKRFVRMLEAHELPRCRFHDLRHAAASIMLLLGIPDKYAMARGGWASDHVMKKAYQQIFSTEEILVAKKIDIYYDELIKKANIKSAKRRTG